MNATLKKARLFLPVIVMGIGLLLGSWLFMNPPVAKKKPAAGGPVQLVEIAPIERGTYKAQIEAMGQVSPAFSAEIRAQVSGTVMDTTPEFMPGGRFQKDDAVILIDFEDYMLTQQKHEAIVKQAEAALQLEMGRQTVAKNEMKILSRTTGRTLDNPALALRAPQRTPHFKRRQSKHTRFNRNDGRNRRILDTPVRART